MSIPSHPAFFDDLPAIRLRDPLADFLGAAQGGLLEYRYVDAVKLAGHSCPTVAAAYGLTRQALKALYAEALPERGGIGVAFADSLSSGVTGVIASVVSLITGAAGEGGFKGLAGHFGRRKLLDFEVGQSLEMRFTRRDSGQAVDCAAQLGRVPADPAMGVLLQRCLYGTADEAERRAFGELWQDRVRRILVEHGDDPEVFVVRPAEGGLGR